MRIQSASILAVIGLLAASDRTSAQAQTYHLTDLGSINTNPQTGQTISHAAGINSAGQVAGYSYSGPNIHAVRFTNGLVEDLGTIPGGTISFGLGINDLGQVVGDSQYSVNGGSIRRAALFSNGTVTDLGILPGWGNYSRATAINQAGEVVGYSGPTDPTASPSPTQTRAFIWDASNGMRDLGTLGGAGYSKALSINNSGLVTGEARTATGGGTHAFIWDATGGMRDIGTIAGDFSVGNSINANGHVAGKSSINSFDNRDHAFFYDGTTMHDLGSLGTGHFFSDRSVAYGINIHDHVVGGTYRLYTGGSLYAVPFIYRDGQMYDLSTLVDASGDDYQLGVPTGINDAGQIAINHSHKRSTNEIHAVLLTPNGPWPSPTPTTPTPTLTPTPTPCGTPTNFANTTPISIPILGSATPYPATIAVAALAGNVTKVTVKLNNLSHTYADDVDILLVGPGGQNAIILSDVGGGTQPMSVTLTLDDAAVSNLPDSTSLSSGTFKPTNIESGDTFPAPAPAPSGGSALSVFNGTNPNGTWSLYVVDDLNSDAGNVAGGWELNITTDTCGSSTPTPAPSTTPGATPTPTSTPAPTATPGAMPTPTLTPAPSTTPGATPTPTLTPVPTATPPGATPTPTPTPVSTATPSPTPIATPTPTSTPAPSASPSATPATPPAQPLNISTRSRVLGGDSALVGGFILTGSDSKQVIIRAIGPSLGANGLPGALNDTTLDLYDSNGQLLASNDNWKEPHQAQIQATGLAPSDPLESAILATLSGSNSYTAVVRGKNGATGVGLVEIYDIGLGANAKLGNISTRGFVDTGDNVMIGGFIVGGGAASQTRMVVRAMGPSLSRFGITNALLDPTLSLYNSNGSVMATNDNWRDGQQPEIIAAGLAPTDDRESALFQSLSPGAYTAIVAGKGGAIGVGLVEAYNVP